MKVIKPGIEVVFHPPEGFDSFEQFIEYCGRTCYKSEDKITEESAPKFVKMLRDRGHHAMLEFGYATARITADRGLTHELVRHRLCSFAQESTRFCNYSKGKFGGEITAIAQPWKLTTSSAKYDRILAEIEKTYLELLDDGEPPELARSILPIGLKSEINIGCNLREWRHVFEMRCSKKAHPTIRGIMLKALRIFVDRIPAVYEDLAEKFLEADNG